MTIQQQKEALEKRADELDRREAHMEKVINRRGRKGKQERQRIANVAGWKRRNKQTTAIKLARNVAYAETKLVEIKELAKLLKPFLQNGAIMLGKAWDELMADQIRMAQTGTQYRIVTNKQGVPILDDDGKEFMADQSVSPAEQAAARKHLIEMFPKLIPPESKSTERDPLLLLAAKLKEGGVGRMALEVNGVKEDNEPDEVIVEGVGRMLNDDDNPAVIDTDSQNA